ncbi:MAG: TraV family lipoprotein [Pseudomonadota bacterium]
MRICYCLWFVILAACHSNNSLTNRDCPLGEGVHCKSISQVNQLVDQHGASYQRETTGESLATNKLLKQELLAITPIDQLKKEPQNSTVIRLPEKTMRIWLNSFTDQDGDFIQENYTYTVIEPGKWLEE